MTDIATPAETLPTVEEESPGTPEVDAFDKLTGLVNEARLVLAQDPMSPVAMFVLAWDQQIGTAVSKTREIADTLKPKGGPTAAEVRKLIAESDNEEVVQRREMLAKLDEKRKELLGQMHTLVGAGTPEIDGDEKAALKETYKTYRDLATKSATALESMFTIQNSAEGLSLVKALSEAIPSLTGSTGGAATGVRRTRFESVYVMNHEEGPKDFGTFSKLLTAKGVKERDVSEFYKLYDAASPESDGGRTFELSGGQVVRAVPKNTDN